MTRLTIANITEGLKSKKFSVQEIVDQYHAKACMNICNEYVTVVEKDSLTPKIELSQKRINEGKEIALEGIPGSIKDLFCTNGIKTTGASKILHNFTPSYDATVVSELDSRSGYIMLGKNNMDEMAMGSLNKFSYYGPVLSPIKNNDTGAYDFAPGGSSGGSAASVAAGSSVFSIGSDTGGSIRQPAALCGVVGVKPTYGMASRYGMLPLCNSMDQAGAITNNVEDAALILDIIASRYDPKDLTSIPKEKRAFANYRELIHTPLKGLKVGIIEDFYKSVTPEIKEIWDNTLETLEGLQCEIVDKLNIHEIEKSIMAYVTLTCADTYSNLCRYDGVRYGYDQEQSIENFEHKSLEDMYFNNRTGIFGPEVTRRMCIGEFVLHGDNYEKYFIKAAKIRGYLIKQLQKVFEKVDVLVLPTTLSNSYALKNSNLTILDAYLNDALTSFVNLIGSPGISVPTHKCKHGYPFGMQVVAKPGNDHIMLQVANALDRIYNHR